jgi:hypothetical protein
MIESFDYYGHTVEVRSSRTGRRWTWEYTIDGRNFKRNSEVLATNESTAICDGRWHAQDVIDRMA